MTCPGLKNYWEKSCSNFSYSHSDLLRTQYHTLYSIRFFSLAFSLRYKLPCVWTSNKRRETFQRKLNYFLAAFAVQLLFFIHSKTCRFVLYIALSNSYKSLSSGTVSRKPVVLSTFRVPESWSWFTYSPKSASALIAAIRLREVSLFLYFLRVRTVRTVA